MTEIVKNIDAWWNDLNDDVRAALTANPDKLLTGAEVVEIARVRLVGPAGARWVDGSEEYSFHLSGEDQDSIREHAKP